MLKFRRSFRLAVLLLSATTLASCGGDTDNNASFRMIQASPDLAPVNFLVDGVILTGAIDYKRGPGFLTVTPQSYEFAIEAILPDANGVAISVPVFPPVKKAIAAGNEYTLIAIGKDATDSAQPLIIENPIEAVPLDSVRLQFVHAAPDVTPVDIYLTAVPALPALLPDLATQTPVTQVTYGEQPAARQLILPGPYVIRATLAGSPVPLFESGETTLSNGSDFLLVVVENTAAGPSPISLAVNSGRRAGFSRDNTSDILDKDTPTDLRVVQVSPDAPAIDVVGTRPQEPAIPPATELPPLRTVTFASGLTYLNSTGYVPAPPDNYTLRGFLTSEPDAATPRFTVTPNPASLVIGQRTTLFVNGLLASISPILRTDDIRAVHAEGKLRVVNASPASGTVDVYIRATGTDIADVAPTLQGLVSGSATLNLVFFPGTYTVTFTTAGSKTVLATKEVAATEGTVQTVILRDAVRVDGSDGKPAEVLLLDDRSG